MIEGDMDRNLDDKVVIKCEKINWRQLNDAEAEDVRVFYWAAYYGFDKYVRHMIVSRRWSPYIKSFKNRSVISGAIWGEKIETVRMMLGEYHYENTSHDNLIDLATTIFNKDSADNNCLHYSYMIDLPEVRQILRDNNLF